MFRFCETMVAYPGGTVPPLGTKVSKPADPVAEMGIGPFVSWLLDAMVRGASRTCTIPDPCVLAVGETVPRIGF